MRGEEVKRWFVGRQLSRIFRVAWGEEVRVGGVRERSVKEKRR